MTLYTPIYVLMILLPLGVLIPGSYSNSLILDIISTYFSVQSGEKMGFQVTLLLATFLYVEYFQNNMPTFSEHRQMEALSHGPNLDTIYAIFN